MQPSDEDVGTPVSVKIRERIAAARKRFNANDNIADFIEPGELAALLDEVEVKMRGVLDSLVIDTDNDHNTANTARRVAKMYLNEVFRGRYVAAPPITEFPNAEHLNELMIVGPITVRSACSHHFCPVIGSIWIGVLPNEHTNVIGLSKYARLAEWVMGRPQIQEEAVVQLADLIQEKTQPDGLAIVMEASHYRMHRPTKQQTKRQFSGEAKSRTWVFGFQLVHRRLCSSGPAGSGGLCLACVKPLHYGLGAHDPPFQRVHLRGQAPARLALRPCRLHQAEHGVQGVATGIVDQRLALGMAELEGQAPAGLAQLQGIDQVFARDQPRAVLLGFVVAFVTLVAQDLSRQHAGVGLQCHARSARLRSL